jgi:hypothetical protein
MGFYVPYNYIKLYSSKDQGAKTLDIIKLYSAEDYVITDSTAGIGGNSVIFATYYKKINCIEIDKDAFKILKSNLKWFTNCHFYNNDYLSICKILKQDIIFLDPPWELNYKIKKESGLELSGVPIKNVIENLYTYCKIIALKCPINFECIVNSWDFTTHYIYKNRRVMYKIIIYHKYT